MGQSLASFVTPVGQEKYYVFLICSQEKDLHFQDKSEEKAYIFLNCTYIYSRQKSGKNIRQDVYEPCFTFFFF